MLLGFEIFCWISMFILAIGTVLYHRRYGESNPLAAIVVMLVALMLHYLRS